ncbi:MAG: VWA domain-containing protein [Flavobacteriaceae bacterium]|nr:VWA domain-containing protein [Flavobacteriaceae bacterium]
MQMQANIFKKLFRLNALRKCQLPTSFKRCLSKHYLLRIAHCLLLTSFCLLLSATWSTAQQRTTRILFLLDGSGSMYAKLDKDIRINVAKRLLTHIVDSLKGVQNVELALRCYGHTNPPAMRDCNDTRLEVAFAEDNHDLIKEKLKNLSPKGTTLIAHSLTMAAGDFPKDPGARNVIILITDGIEECKGDPCAVSEALQKSGVVLKPFVIGMGGDERFMETFRCVGKYYEANTEIGFSNVLNVIISQAMNNTTAQVNLLDAYGRAVESNVGMSFYNMTTGALEYNFVHTMNDRGRPDTLTLEPTIKYRVMVHTMPPVELENVELIPGKHTIIPVDVPQGNLKLVVNGLGMGEKVECIVRQANESWTLTEQDFNTTRRYITGRYDLEILTLPRIQMKELSIQQSNTTEVQIPTPGKLSMLSSNDLYGAIYQWNRNRLEWVCDIDVNIRRKVLSLQPSLDKPYTIIYRYKHNTKASFTIEKEFRIQSGITTQLNL